eukprot:3537284-Rhodomonas_salina.1
MVPDTRYALCRALGCACEHSPFTLSPFTLHPFTLSTLHSFTLSPFHPFTSVTLHPFTPFTLHPFALEPSAFTLNAPGGRRRSRPPLASTPPLPPRPQ